MNQCEMETPIDKQSGVRALLFVIQWRFRKPEGTLQVMVVQNGCDLLLIDVLVLDLAVRAAARIDSRKLVLVVLDRTRAHIEQGEACYGVIRGVRGNKNQSTPSHVRP